MTDCSSRIIRYIIYDSVPTENEEEDRKKRVKTLVEEQVRNSLRVF